MTQITNEDIDAADGFDGIVKFKTDLWNNWYLVEMRRDDPIGYYIHPLHGMGMDDATRSYITQLRARAEAAERKGWNEAIEAALAHAETVCPENTDLHFSIRALKKETN